MKLCLRRSWFSRLQLALIVFGTVVFSWPLAAQQLPAQTEMRLREAERKITAMEQTTENLKHSQSGAAAGAVAWLFGAFCALWAQNTGRNAWLWFFLGLIFSVIAVIFLLVKNSGDRKPRNPRMFSEGRRQG